MDEFDSPQDHQSKLMIAICDMHQYMKNGDHLFTLLLYVYVGESLQTPRNELFGLQLFRIPQAFFLCNKLQCLELLKRVLHFALNKIYKLTNDTRGRRSANSWSDFTCACSTIEPTQIWALVLLLFQNSIIDSFTSSKKNLSIRHLSQCPAQSIVTIQCSFRNSSPSLFIRTIQGDRFNMGRLLQCKFANYRFYQIFEKSSFTQFVNVHQIKGLKIFVEKVYLDFPCFRVDFAPSVKSDRPILNRSPCTYVP